MLITSGSGQAIDLINQVLLEPGDTVILEEFTYGGYLTKLRRLGVNIVGAPLDEDGIRIDALAAILADLKKKGTTPKYICTDPDHPEPDRQHHAAGATPRVPRPGARTTACRSSRTNAMPTSPGAA